MPDATVDCGSADSTGFVEPPLPLPRRTDDTRCQLNGTRGDALPRVLPEPMLDPLRFERTLGVTALPGQPQVLFVFEQRGLVHRVDHAQTLAKSWVVLATSGRVGARQTQEDLRYELTLGETTPATPSASTSAAAAR